MILIGAVQNEPIWLSFRHASSLLIAGQSGSGKTTLAATYVAQLQHQGMRLVVYDPHYPHPQSLGARVPVPERLLLPVLTEVWHIRAVLTYARVTMQYRLKHPRPWYPPVVIVIDEFFSLIAADKATRAQIMQELTVLTSQGRKAGIFLLCITQEMDRVTADMNTVRHRVSEVILLKMRHATLIDPTAPETLTLPYGKGWYRGQVITLARYWADPERINRQYDAMPAIVGNPIFLGHAPKALALPWG